MACYYVKLTDSDLGTDVGFLSRGERRQTVLCSSYYRAYHFATRHEAEQAAHHFCQEVKGVAVNLEQGENREYDFGFEVIELSTPQLV